MIQFVYEIRSIFTTNMCEKRSIQYTVLGFKPSTSEHESPPITTRPGGLPPFYPSLLIHLFFKKAFSISFEREFIRSRFTDSSPFQFFPTFRFFRCNRINREFNFVKICVTRRDGNSNGNGDGLLFEAATLFSQKYLKGLSTIEPNIACLIK